MDRARWVAKMDDITLSFRRSVSGLATGRVRQGGCA